MGRKVFSYKEQMELREALNNASLLREITFDPEAFQILIQYITTLEKKIQTMANIIHEQQAQIEYYVNME